MPMGKCPKCSKCFLFLKDTVQEDQKLVEEMKRKVEEEYKKEHPELAAKEVRVIISRFIYIVRTQFAFQIQIGPKEEKKKGGKKAKKGAFPAVPMPAFNLAAINPFAGMQPSKYRLFGRSFG